MFKKPFKVQSQNLLKGSEKKKLKDNILKSFPSLTPQDVDAILPTKEAKMVKISGSPVIIYCDGTLQPLFFLTQDSELFPTVYALWRAPKMLPTINVHAPVLKYIAGGADLMLPGVILGADGVPNFKKGEMRSVILNGNESGPVAVGIVKVNREDVLKFGMKGKCLETVHYLSDALWQFGDKSSPPMALPTPKAEDTEDKNEEAADSAEVTPDASNEGKEDKDAEESKGGDDATSGEAVNEAVEEDQNAPAPMSNDELIEYCFLCAIKYRVKDPDLPILVSSFYSAHMLPCRPPNTNIDIKKSKYKKLSTYLQEQEKNGLIKLTEESPGVFHLASINRAHDTYISFKPAVKPVKEEKKVSVSKQPELIIDEIYRPHSPLLPFFPHLNTDNREELYVTEPQVRDALAEYIKVNNLSSERDKRYIKLDSLMTTTLFGGKKVPGEEFLKKDIFPLFLSKTQKYTRIQRGSFTKLKKGSVSPVQISVENRQGGKKHVTYVSGLETFGISPETMAAVFRKEFAASTTVNDMPGKTAGKEVFIQGNVAKGVGDHLYNEYGIPKRLIEIKEAPKPKKKP